MNISGLISVSNDFVLELLVSRLYMSYFFYKILVETAPKKRIYKVIFQNSAVQTDQWLSFLSCFVTMEKTICPLYCTEFNESSVCTSETAVHNFCNACNETVGVAYFARDYLSPVSASTFVMKTPVQKKWESANKFLF